MLAKNFKFTYVQVVGVVHIDIGVASDGGGVVAMEVKCLARLRLPTVLVTHLRGDSVKECDIVYRQFFEGRKTCFKKLQNAAIGRPLLSHTL